MKVQKLARWVEVIANLAVVASVVFLSLEIRNNTKTIEAQSINDRSYRLNQPYINSPLIPSILQKIKEVDGPEGVEVLYMKRYGLSYAEAGIWARYLSSVFLGLEAEYLRDGPSKSLKDRIQLLSIFPDVQIPLNTGFAQVQTAEFKDYINHIINSPLDDNIEKYKSVLDSLKMHVSNLDSIPEINKN